MDPYHSLIFRSFTKEEITDLYNCGKLRQAYFHKGEVIFSAGEQCEEFGLLCKGKIHIEQIDVWGNRMILHELSAGHCFAETYAFSKARLMVNVIAMEDSLVLFIPLNRLLAEEYQHKSWYSKLLYNTLQISADKNLLWSNRMFCISSRSIRAKVMRYLSNEAIKHGSMDFHIPFDRQQMADYLNVERTALSKELSHMQKEGILSYHKDHFILHQKPVC